MVKLTKLEIEGFRGARFPIQLDFTNSSKSVLIHGRNGAGKSTFTDAVEWFFRKRVEQLWKEDCFEESLRNLNLSDTEDTTVALKFSDSNLDGQQILDSKLKVSRSNKSPGFNAHIAASEGERLVLRHGDLQPFVVMQKGKKKEVIANIIGYDAVIDFRDKLNSTLNKLEKDPELALARKTLEKNRGTMMATFKRFVETDADLYSVANDLITALELKVTISTEKQYGECLQQLEGRLTAKDRGSKQLILSQAVNLCESSTESIRSAREQIDGFAQQYQEVLKTKGKIIQLNLEEFLKTGRKILDEGWTKQDICPFCGSAMGFDHLREELNKRIDEMKEVRVEFEGTEKSKNLAVKALQNAERMARDFSTKATAAGADPKGLQGLSEYANSASMAEQKIVASFQSYSSLPDFQSLNVKTDQVLALLDGEKAKFEQRAKELESSSEEKALLDVFGKMKDLHNLFHENITLSKSWAAFQRQITTLSKLKEEFVETQNTALQDALDVMSEDIKKFYLVLHPNEEVDDVKMRILGEEGVEFRYSFHGKETGPPLKYLSESHLNSLGIAFFLSSVRLFNKRNRFFVLDDVVTSFDSEHRMRLVRLLEDEFSDFQILLLTHESFWFEIIQRELGDLGWLIKEVDWTYDNGIQWESGSGDLRKLIDEKRALKLPIGNDVRKLLEKLLMEICRSLRVRMVYMPNGDNERRMVGELLSELRGTLNEKDCPARESLVLSRLMSTNFLTSSQSHYGAVDPSPGDLEVSLNDIKELDALFRCAHCQRLVSTQFQRPSEKKVYCKCGKTALDWRQ